VNWALPPPYHPLTDEQVQRDLRTVKALNVNYVRRILRSTNPRFLFWADRAGVLVQEGGPWMAATGIKDRKAFEHYEQGWRDIIEHDRNHPSVATWELFTENSGLGTGEFASWNKSRGLLREMYDYAKTLDPTRLALDDSGGRSCCNINYPGNHAKTDIDDVLFLGDASTSWIQGVEEYREYAARIMQLRQTRDRCLAP
jgi:beta-galactosidase/beta-glucuronidase